MERSGLFEILAARAARTARGGTPLIAITGGGGKTSLLFGLGRELARSRRTLVTTTTKIFRPASGECDNLYIGAAEGCQTFLEASPRAALLAAGSRVEGGKLIGFSPDEADALAASGAAGAVIAECDGSRGRSMKHYEEWEPPVPRGAAALFAVVGADCLGAPAIEENIFRCPQLCRELGLAVGSEITAGDIAACALLENGPLKNAPASAQKFLLFNKWETLEREEAERLKALFPALLKRYDAVAAISARLDRLYEFKVR